MDRRQIGQVNLDQSDFQVAIASCMDDRFEEDQDQIWHDLAKDNPQYLFMIGDNVYATSILKIGEKFVDKDRLWERYVETRQKLAIFSSPHSFRPSPNGTTMITEAVMVTKLIPIAKKRKRYLGPSFRKILIFLEYFHMVPLMPPSLRPSKPPLSSWIIEVNENPRE